MYAGSRGALTRKPAPLTAEAFAEGFGVSRETLDRLERYVALLRRWQPRINLVSRESLEDVWRRHIWDSAQILRHLPGSVRSLLDVGSGAGLPGLVLAVLGAPGVMLVEADRRKAAFLREAARIAAAPVTIHPDRLENLADRIATPDVITARAVAPLASLLGSLKLYIGPNTVCLLHKGRRVDAELAKARQSWRFTAIKIPSETDPAGLILRLEELTRVRTDRGEE